ncbi:hypothetical protein GGD65_004156 [Bradyrhizobium sp. CIR18]|nr:hypothetical protein [Bradyrhizobium sp. CIR18]
MSRLCFVSPGLIIHYGYVTTELLRPLVSSKGDLSPGMSVTRCSVPQNHWPLLCANGLSSKPD